MTKEECEIETSKAIMEMRTNIAELEKEKCELLGIIQGKDKVIQELEKENAELKEQCSILADCNTCYSTCKTENVEMRKQLTKADGIIRAYQKGAEFGYNKVNEQLTLPKDILGLWEQTVCEIRSEIKSWDLKGPHVSDYAKELCDKLEHSLCDVAGGSYSLKYSITD